jgi:hypothetical protein
MIVGMQLKLLAFTLAFSAIGCERSTNPPPMTQPSVDYEKEYFRFDDARCSPDQRRAIRAATLAVTGNATPSPADLVRLHFSCLESADGWFLTVWNFGPAETPAPGGFTGVILNRDFSLRSVVGGA